MQADPERGVYVVAMGPRRHGRSRPSGVAASASPMHVGAAQRRLRMNYNTAMVYHVHATSHACT